jgi:predicted amidohydrolase YtcJ
LTQDHEKEGEATLDGEEKTSNESEAREQKKGLSRRQFLVGGAAAGAAVSVAGLGIGRATGSAQPEAVTRVSVGSARKPGTGVDVALLNGKIHTMDGTNQIVSQVLIEDGRFTLIGNPKDKLGKDKQDKFKDKSGETLVIDLKGKVVVPGIIDNHNHIILMGNRPGYHTPLENAYSIADVQALYAARAANAPAGAWITTIGGFNTNHFAELRLPTLAELDAAVPNNPVLILQGFTGPAATNTKGKQFFESVPAPTGPITVSATGQLSTAGSNASRAMLALRQTLLNPAERRRSTLDAIAYGLGLGVTSHLDQGAFQKTNTPADGAAHEDNFTMQLPFLELHRAGELNARVQINFLHMESDPNLPELKQRLKNQFQFFGDDVLMTGGIGEFIAQGVGPTFQQAARLVAEAGWRAECHSLSTTDFMSEISAYELANAEFPITDLRWVVAHVPRITLEWVNRLKAIGGGLSLTGWQYLAGSLPATAPQYAGPPFRLIVDSGIPAGMSSDGMQIAPMNPWIHMYYATTGLNARGVQINPNQQITRQEVLELYTKKNGWFLRREDDVGSIEEGKLADLTVLNKDYFTVPDLELKSIRSRLTLVGGEVVHSDGSVV